MISIATMRIVASVLAINLGCANTNRSRVQKPNALTGEPASAEVLDTEPTSNEVPSVEESTSDLDLPPPEVKVPEPELLRYPEEAIEMTEQVASIFKKYEGKARCEELATALNTWIDQNGARYRAVARIQSDKRYDYDQKRTSAAMEAMVDGMLACYHHNPKVKEAMLRIS